jgi:hypothetical protein
MTDLPIAIKASYTEQPALLLAMEIPTSHGGTSSLNFYRKNLGFFEASLSNAPSQTPVQPKYNRPSTSKTA